MLSKIFRFLRKNIHFTILPLVGAVWGGSVGLALTGKLDAINIIVSQIAWAVAGLSTIAMVIYYNKARSCQETLDDAITIIEHITGYREDLIDEIAIYSKMVHTGVPAPVTNAIVSLAQELKDSDTVFLIRVSHDEGAWYIRVAGKPIHLKQALFIMDLIKDRIRNSASKKGFIFKKENGIVN
jgi:hypothetical protein